VEPKDGKGRGSDLFQLIIQVSAGRGCENLEKIKQKIKSTAQNENNKKKIN
jgi:hypothetical protein